MSEATLSLRVRLSSPKPAYCAACWRGAEENLRFVDFDSAVDRGTLTNEQGWMLDGIDDLHLCEPCVRSAVQALDLKLDVHREQLLEIDRLEVDRDHWKNYAAELEETLGRRPIGVETRASRRKRSGA